jgi:hypothetical protein
MGKVHKKLKRAAKNVQDVVVGVADKADNKLIEEKVSSLFVEDTVGSTKGLSKSARRLLEEKTRKEKKAAKGEKVFSKFELRKIERAGQRVERREPGLKVPDGDKKDKGKKLWEVKKDGKKVNEKKKAKVTGAYDAVSPYVKKEGKGSGGQINAFGKGVKVSNGKLAGKKSTLLNGKLSNIKTDGKTGNSLTDLWGAEDADAAPISQVQGSGKARAPELTGPVRKAPITSGSAFTDREMKEKNSVAWGVVAPNKRKYLPEKIPQTVGKKTSAAPAVILPGDERISVNPGERGGTILCDT